MRLEKPGDRRFCRLEKRIAHLYRGSVIHRSYIHVYVTTKIRRVGRIYRSPTAGTAGWRCMCWVSPTDIWSRHISSERSFMEWLDLVWLSGRRRLSSLVNSNTCPGISLQLRIGVSIQIQNGHTSSPTQVLQQWTVWFRKNQTHGAHCRTLHCQSRETGFESYSC